MPVPSKISLHPQATNVTVENAHTDTTIQLAIDFYYANLNTITTVLYPRKNCWTLYTSAPMLLQISTVHSYTYSTFISVSLDRQAPVVQRNRQSYRVTRDNHRRTYGQAARSIRTEPSGPRWTGVGFYIGRRQETLDAEVFAIVRAIRARASRQRDFTISTDA